MFLSKRSNGIWYVFYDQPNGKRTSKSTGTKYKAEAFKFLSNLENELKKRNDSKVIPIDLESYKKQYLKYSESIHSYKTTRSIKGIFNSFIEFIGNPQLSDITLSDVKTFLQIKRQVSVYTSQKYLAYLRKAFNEAMDNGYINSNPFKSIPNYKIPEKQPVFFNDNEFDVFIDSVDNRALKDAFIFAVNTGLRINELTSLQWDQINFKDKFIILSNHNHLTKSKKVRSIPLNIAAMQILVEREKINKSGNVFSYKGKNIDPTRLSKLFKKHIMKAGLNPQLKFHSLRHTFASWLVQKGVSIFHVSKLLGHSDIKTSEIYSHLRTDDLRISVELLS